MLINILTSLLLNKILYKKIFSFFFLFLAALITPKFVLAGLSITSISGASAIEQVLDIDSEETGNISVYGGMVGPDCTDPQDDETCNNCSETNFIACNEKRIHGGLNLKIGISTDSETTEGTIIIGEKNDKGLILDTDITIGPNETAVIDVPWSDICSGLGHPSNCKADFDDTIQIGISTDSDQEIDEGTSDVRDISIFVQHQIGLNVNPCPCDSPLSCPTPATGSGPTGATEGLCNFKVIPGDSKVELIQVRSPEGFPTFSQQIEFEYVRFYCAPVGNFASITPKDLCAELEIIANEDSTYDLGSNRIEDLENGKTYRFRTATVDQAGNIGYYSSATTDTHCEDQSTTCHIATPDEVLGVLSKDNNCFIATATYGSPLANKVVDFRKFRSKFLHPYFLGKKFIYFYNKYGPYPAKFIKNRPTLKKISTALLFPIWIFAKSFLTLGAIPASFFWLLLLAGLFIFIQRFKRKSNA